MLLFTDLFELLHLLAERRLVPGHQQAAEAAGHAAEAASFTVHVCSVHGSRY